MAEIIVRRRRPSRRSIPLATSTVTTTAVHPRCSNLLLFSGVPFTAQLFRAGTIEDFALASRTPGRRFQQAMRAAKRLYEQHHHSNTIDIFFILALLSRHLRSTYHRVVLDLELLDGYHTIIF
jgi:hypothetical protein